VLRNSARVLGCAVKQASKKKRALVFVFFSSFFFRFCALGRELYSTKVCGDMIYIHNFNASGVTSAAWATFLHRPRVAAAHVIYVFCPPADTPTPPPRQTFLLQSWPNVSEPEALLGLQPFFLSAVYYILLADLLISRNDLSSGTIIEFIVIHELHLSESLFSFIQHCYCFLLNFFQIHHCL
jgi:hypothetical protein